MENESVSILSQLMAFDWASIIQAILMILGGASIIAKMTPTKADDKVIDTLLKIIHLAGLTKDNNNG